MSNWPRKKRVGIVSGRIEAKEKPDPPAGNETNIKVLELYHIETVSLDRFCLQKCFLLLLNGIAYKRISGFKQLIYNYLRVELSLAGGGAAASLVESGAASAARSPAADDR